MAYSKKVVDKFENTEKNEEAFKVGKFEKKEDNEGRGRVGEKEGGDVRK